MTSQLISLGLSDCLSSPVRAKVECCKLHDPFIYQVNDCSTTRIPSSSIMGCHPQPTGGLTPFTAPVDRVVDKFEIKLIFHHQTQKIMIGFETLL